MAIDPAMAIKLAQIVGKLGMYLAARRKAKAADEKYNTNVQRIKDRGPTFYDEPYRKMWDKTGDEEGDQEALLREMGY